MALRAAVSLLFGAMWLDWLRAILNSDGSLDYSIQEVPVMALPLVALAGSRFRGLPAIRGRKALVGERAPSAAVPQGVDAELGDPRLGKRRSPRRP